MEVLVEECVPFRPDVLRLVHGGVGVTDARSRRRRVAAGDHDAHARGDDRARGPLEIGALEHLDESLRRADGVALVADVADEEDELVAAEARRGVAGRQCVREPPPTSRSSASPVSWPRLSFTILKPVEVQEQDREAGAVTRATGELLVEAVEEQRAVGEARQLVVVRLAGQRLWAFSSSVTSSTMTT